MTSLFSRSPLAMGTLAFSRPGQFWQNNIWADSLLLSVWTLTCCGRCPHDGHSRIPSMLPRGKVLFPGCLLSAGKPPDHTYWWCENILLLLLKLLSIRKEGAQLGLTLLLRCWLGKTVICQFLWSGGHRIPSLCYPSSPGVPGHFVFIFPLLSSCGRCLALFQGL
jgi:hypothetical protein